MLKKFFIYSFIYSFIAIIVLQGVGFVFAFTGPPVNCVPGNCVSAPLLELKPENIKQGVTIGGVSGGVTAVLPNCVSTGEINCTSTSSVQAVSVTELAAQICSGVIFAGVTGVKDCSAVSDINLAGYVLTESGLTYNGALITAGDQITLEMFNYIVNFLLTNSYDLDAYILTELGVTYNGELLVAGDNISFEMLNYVIGLLGGI